MYQSHPLQRLFYIKRYFPHKLTLIYRGFLQINYDSIFNLRESARNLRKSAGNILSQTCQPALFGGGCLSSLCFSKILKYQNPENPKIIRTKAIISACVKCIPRTE